MKIFVTRKTPGKALEKLAAPEHEVVISEFDRPLKEEELVEKVRDVDALLTLLTDRVDGELMGGRTHLGTNSFSCPSYCRGG